MDFGIVAANGIMLPIFATWFIPVAIRDARTGKFKGFFSSGFLINVFLLGWLESILMLNEFGFSLLTLLRIISCVSLAVVLGVVYVILTNKRMFGTSFSFEH